MKIDWEQLLMSMDDEPMNEQYQDAAGEVQARPLTLGRACIGALLDPRAGEHMKGTEKYDCYKLAMRIGRDAEVTTDEVALIKRMAGQVYSTWAVGQIWSRLEGEEP